MELTSQTRAGLDISGGGEVLSYRYTGARPIEALIRVDLGSDAAPIGGGGVYVATVFINGVEIVPTSGVSVDALLNRAILSSREFPVSSNDLISVVVQGQPADTAVDVVTSFRDVTAAQAADLVGDGAVVVDHDYPTADSLIVATRDGIKIDNAVILAYRASDYAAGNRQPNFSVGRTTTDVDGKWRTPLMLDPGTYTLLVYKQGAIQAKTATLVVA
jgi:hypothetical protein